MALKTPIVIFVFCCFFLNIVGYHIIFYWCKAQIKNEMKTAIRLRGNCRDESLFVFSVDDENAIAQINWDGNDEFCFDGQMYDLISRRIENKKLIIRALTDKKETALLDKVSDKWKENDNVNKIANELFQMLQSLFHNAKEEAVAPVRPLRSSFHFYHTSLPCPVKRIPTPPPQPGLSSVS